MAYFEEAVKKTIDAEGGYVNDPDDPGGETKFGISKRAFPGEDIASLTIERAKQIYLMNYWKPVKGDEILDQPIAEAIFDFAVNAGVFTAVQLAQRAVEVKDDGAFGPATLTAINTCDPEIFVLRYTIEKVRKYTGIVQKDKTKLKYYVGWILRAIK